MQRTRPRPLCNQASPYSVKARGTGTVLCRGSEVPPCADTCPACTRLPQPHANANRPQQHTRWRPPTPPAALPTGKPNSEPTEHSSGILPQSKHHTPRQEMNSTGPPAQGSGVPSRRSKKVQGTQTSVPTPRPVPTVLYPQTCSLRA